MPTYRTARHGFIGSAQMLAAVLGAVVGQERGLETPCEGLIIYVSGLPDGARYSAR